MSHPASSSIPAEYSDGYVMFMGRRFVVDARALIPRFETEELVKKALTHLRLHPEITHVIEVGTGSGIITLSLMTKCDRPLHIYATDISPDTLDLARENSEQLKTFFTAGSTIDFFEGDLMMPVMKQWKQYTPESVLIVANLPYLLAADIHGELLYEPRTAFWGGPVTGFELYEKLFKHIHHWKHKPPSCTCMIEFGLWQRDTAETITQQYGWESHFFADLRGIERFGEIVCRDKSPETI